MPHPAIDFSKARIDPAKLERALTLTVTPSEGVDPSTGEVVATGVYEVGPVSAASAKAGILGHWVDLYTADVPRCDCGDHTFRECVCKHILACLLHENHPVVVAALRELVGDLATKLSDSLHDRLPDRLHHTLAQSR